MFTIWHLMTPAFPCNCITETTHVKDSALDDTNIFPATWSRYLLLVLKEKTIPIDQYESF